MIPTHRRMTKMARTKSISSIEAEIKKLEEQKEEAEKKDAVEKAPEKRDHDGKGHGGHHDKKPAGQDS